VIPLEGDYQDQREQPAAEPEPDHKCVMGHPCACPVKTPGHGCPLYGERGEPLHVI
jgi:hypothetical protein